MNREQSALSINNPVQSGSKFSAQMCSQKTKSACSKIPHEIFLISNDNRRVDLPKKHSMNKVEQVPYNHECTDYKRTGIRVSEPVSDVSVALYLYADDIVSSSHEEQTAELTDTEDETSTDREIDNTYHKTSFTRVFDPMTSSITADLSDDEDEVASQENSPSEEKSWCSQSMFTTKSLFSSSSGRTRSTILSERSSDSSSFSLDDPISDEDTIISEAPSHISKNKLKDASRKICNTEPDKNHNFSNCNKNKETNSFYNNAKRCFLFEQRYSFPGFAAFFLHCIAHVSICEFLEVILAEFTDDFDYQVAIYFIVLVAGLLLLRMTGEVWEWLSDDAYERAKVDYQKKRNDIDTYLLCWFKKRPKLKCLLRVISLYTCCIAIEFFSTHVVIPYIFDETELVVAGLPSLNDPHVSTHIKNILTRESFYDEACEDFQYSGNQMVGEINDKICNVDTQVLWSTFEEYRANLTARDAMYIESMISVDSYYKVFGDPDYGIYDEWAVLFFYLVSALSSICILSQLGIDLSWF